MILPSDLPGLPAATERGMRPKTTDGTPDVEAARIADFAHPPGGIPRSQRNAGSIPARWSRLGNDGSSVQFRVICPPGNSPVVTLVRQGLRRPAGQTRLGTGRGAKYNNQPDAPWPWSAADGYSRVQSTSTRQKSRAHGYTDKGQTGRALHSLRSVLRP